MGGMTGEPANRDPWNAGIGGGGLGRLFGEGELWLRWGLPIGSLFGVRVRLHWTFLVLIVVALVMALPLHQSGPGFRLAGLGALMLLVMVHEFAHVFACRRVGGETDEVILWPLGGLGEHHVPRDPRDEMWVALSGPALHLALLPVFGLVLWAVTGSWSAVSASPVDPGGALVRLSRADGTISWWVVLLWSFHAANVVLLAFNLLVPMLPSDAGTLLRSVLWKRRGYQRARWQTAHAGLVAAGVLIVLGAVVVDGKMLIAAGAFGAAVCWGERRRLQFLAGQDPVLDAGPPEPEPEDPGAADQSEVDRILSKISEVGMEGLSGRERRVLKRATRQSRETEGGAGDSDE